MPEKLKVRITKPSGIKHADDKDVRTCIYSLHFHPTQPAKLVTGGLDTKVRIWDTSKYFAVKNQNGKRGAVGSIMDRMADRMTGRDPTNSQTDISNEPESQLLSTLSLHNGAVMCVRFSPDGRLLASGSDGDNIIIIWEPDHSGYRGTVFGSSEVNRESWKCSHRLSGHQSDVVDLCWSPDQSFLASCGLDNTIRIWNADSFVCVKTLDNHEGFVKGLCWDPVGKFLASQADDRSLIFWNTFDWSVAKQVYSGFEKSSGQTFFKRLAWSPDGASICAVNAIDASQIICTASIINRSTFKEDACLVGNRGVVECAAFNPKMFTKSIADTEAYTVCALGSQDGTISIWFQDSIRAPLVLENAFGAPVFDICWSPDGMTLVACSADGTVTFISMENCQVASGMSLQIQSPLGYCLDQKQVEDKLISFGFQPGQKKTDRQDFVIESVEVLKLMQQARETEIETSEDEEMADSNINAESSIEKRDMSLLTPVNTKETITRDLEQPKLPINQLQNVTIKDGKRRIQPILLSSPQQNHILATQTVTQTKDGKKRVQPVSLSSPSAIREQRFGEPSENVELIQTRGTDHRLPPEPLSLPKPLAVSSLVGEVSMETGKLRVNVENAPANLRNKQPAHLTCWLSLNSSWCDYILSPVTKVSLSDQYLVAVCEDHSLIVWSSRGGRRLLPKLLVDGPAFHVECRNQLVLCVTCRGSLWLWNIEKRTCIYDGIAISSCLGAKEEALSISQIRLSKKGVPLIVRSDRKTFAFNYNMKCWMEVEDGSANREVYTAPIDADLVDLISDQPKQIKPSETSREILKKVLSSSSSNQTAKIQEYSSLAFLEERLASAFTLKDKDLYRKTAFMYSKRLGVSRENHSVKVAYFLKYLSKESQELGFDKDAILNEVLPQLSLNPHLQRLVSTYNLRESSQI